MYLVMLYLLNLELTYTPQKQVFSDEPLQIYADVSEEILTAYLLINNETVYMKKDGTRLSASIPAEFMQPPAVKYYIMIKSKDNQLVKSPEYKINVIVRDNLVELITPEPYGSGNNKKPDIIIAFNNEINPQDVRVLLDALDITKDCEITPTSVYYLPANNLSAGEHNLKIVVKNVTEATFNFNVTSAVSAHGYASIGGRHINCYCRDSTSLPYAPGNYLLFDTYINGSLFLPFSFWFNKDEEYDFNFEMEHPKGKLSIGDIYTTSSILTLYGILPKGINVSANLPVNVELLCARVEKADTAYLTYARYIAGGRLSKKLFKADMGLNYYYGIDDSSSMRSMSYEPPLKNDFFTGDLKYPFLKQISGILEFSRSNTKYLSDSLAKIGYAYNVGADLTTEYLDNKLTYNGIDTSYFIIGNPYLEAGKKGVVDEFSANYRNLYSNGNYEIYKIADTTEYILYTYVNYTLGKFSPYVIHSNTLGSTTVSSGLRFTLPRGYCSGSCGVASSGDSLTGNTFRGDLDYEFVRNKLYLRTGYGESRTSTSLSKYGDFRAEIYKMIIFEYRFMKNDNKSTPLYSYEEHIFTLWLKRQF